MECSKKNRFYFYICLFFADIEIEPIAIAR